MSIGVVVLVVSAFVAAGPQDSKKSKPAAKGIEQLAWMAGSWKDAKENQSAEEHWTAPAGNLMVGMHRDVMGKKAFFEYLRIEEKRGKVTYVASPMGRGETRFPMTKCEKQRVVFENPEHDFPQRIVYWLEDGTLHARAEATKDGEVRGQTWSWPAGSLR